MALYPKFQEYFRKFQPAVSGRLGAGTIRSSFRLERERTSATSQARMFASSIPATSRWKRIVQKLLPPFATSSAERQRQQPEMARDVSQTRNGKNHTSEFVAVVTGASQGIGRASAIRLARDFSSHHACCAGIFST